MEEEKSDPDEDSEKAVKEEEEDNTAKGYLQKFIGKVKKVMTFEHLADLIVGGWFDKDDEFDIDYRWEPDALDNGLSFQRMQKMVERKLPRKDGQHYNVCKTNSGWHCCCKKYRKTDMAELGIGLSLYFKMIKYFITLFGIFTLISIPLYVYFTDGDGLCSVTSSTSGVILSSITLGNLGSKVLMINPFRITNLHIIGGQ